MLPFSRATKNTGEARAVTDAVGLQIHKDHFHEMLHEIPVLGQRLVSIMSDRVRRSTQFIDHREKMSALGKMAAGLAHELNNPASALKRSSMELRDRLNNMLKIGSALVSLDASAEDIKAAAELRDKLLVRTPKELTPVQRGEREDEMSDWLEAHGIPEPWVLAENLVDVGATIEELEQLADLIGHVEGGLVLGLRWIHGSTSMHRMVGEIISASERIAQLVQSIKVHAHMDRNPDKQPVDIRDGIESTLTILGHKLRKKAIKVKREYDEQMPKVPAYPGELNQVWTNLFDNAIDAMDEGGTLTIKTGKDGGCVCARICDNGAGIPKDVVGRIFEPFFTTKPMGEGTGIGLDIVHRIVTVQHGGDIKVESEPGNTCFTVWFPMTPTSRLPASQA
ncbi:MAG: hypothetical protein H6839_03985 [Planctomycetes bacterium]|nr:hypothetical protein [Planctomycetota bacterium]